MKVLNPIDELKSTEAWKYLNSIDESYSSFTISFLSLIIPILKKISTIFPHYTRHDAHHGYNVLKRVENIVSKECFKKNHKLAFDKAEIFLLICAAYAHDLGMSIFPGEEDSLKNQLNLLNSADWLQSPILLKYLRDQHSLRGGEYINKNSSALFVPQNLVYPLHQLMTSHNLSINELDKEFQSRTAANGKEIDMKQLACILCIADAIEFSDTRVIDGVLNVLAEKVDKESLISYKENMKHLAIGDSVAVGRDGKIIFSGTFNDAEVLNLAHKTVDLVEDWVKGYCDIDYSSPKKRLKIRSDSISRNFKSLDFDFERLGIRIKKDNIISLISSNSTWASTGSAAIRELLQNSVEACRYRMHNTNRQELYKPLIQVHVDFEKRLIKICDNGCGMSRNILLNNFLTVGSSRSFDPSYKSSNYYPLAKFGIGFWSVFTIADNCVVRTAPYESLSLTDSLYEVINGLQCIVSIDEFKDYTIFKEIQKSAGTELILNIKKDINLKDLALGITNLMTCSEIEIDITIANEINHVPKQPILPPLPVLFGPKKQWAVDANVKFFSWKSSNSEYEFVYDIYFTEIEKLTFLLNHNTFNITANRHTSNTFSICGFRVQINELNSFFLANSVGISILNARIPKDFIYNLNRNTLIENGKYFDIQQIMLDYKHNAYRDFLIAHNLYNPTEIYRLNSESRRNSGGGIALISPEKFNSIYLKHSDLICFSFIKLEKGKKVQNVARKYLNLKEVITSNFDVYIMLTRLSLRNPAVVDAELVRFQLHYDLITSLIGDSNKSYIHETHYEEALLLDHSFDITVYVQQVIIPNSKPFKIAIAKIHTNNIDSSKSQVGTIQITQGLWPGTISFHDIQGANFVIFEINKAVIRKNSLLAYEITQLYSTGNLREICDIIILLQQADEGFVDDLIKKFL